MRGDRENIEKTLNLGDARLSNMNKVLVVIKLLLNKVLMKLQYRFVMFFL